MSTTTTRPLDCPRCGGPIPTPEHPGEYPGALSRWDNDTELCSACGVDEAIHQMTAPGGVKGKQQAIHPTLGNVRWALFAGRSLKDEIDKEA